MAKKHLPMRSITLILSNAMKNTSPTFWKKGNKCFDEFFPICSQIFNFTKFSSRWQEENKILMEIYLADSFGNCETVVLVTNFNSIVNQSRSFINPMIDYRIQMVNWTIPWKEKKKQHFQFKASWIVIVVESVKKIATKRAKSENTNFRSPSWRFFSSS